VPRQVGTGGRRRTSNRMNMHKNALYGVAMRMSEHVPCVRVNHLALAR
jgi:hypothetical protein